MISDRVRILFFGYSRALGEAFTHVELVVGVGADHAICFKGSITHLARRMTTDASNLNVVDLLCLQE